MTLSAALTLGLYLSAGADLATTRAAVHRGAYETNPVAGQSPYRQGLTAFGSAGAMHWTARTMEADHPRWATALKLGYIGARGFVAAHNMRVAR